jgi:hypothetical protein
MKGITQSGGTEQEAVPKPAERPRRRRELSATCPDCGQVLVRPEDFSAERLLFLHRKWGGCVPPGAGSRRGADGPSEGRSAAG